MFEKKSKGFFVLNEKGLEKINEQNLIRQDLGNILFENAMDKARIVELESLTGNLLFEIALLKGGIA